MIVSVSETEEAEEEFLFLFFFTKKKKKKKKKKWAATALWQCNALQEFLTPKKKKTWLFSVSEIEKEVEEEFLQRRKSVKRAHQKRES